MSLKIALAGNPNAGKTTLFNELTGSNQFVGNWPGVTVEKKEGKLIGYDDVIITDLPGVYSLSPYTLEEVVARNYLLDERPDAILNIIDGTNLERNLYLTTQLVELGIPVVIAINMMDVVRKKGDVIDFEILSKKIGCPVVEISALKGAGTEEVAKLAVEVAREGKTIIPKHNFSGCAEHAIAHIEEAVFHDIPEERQRWYAIKVFERDKKVIESFQIDDELLMHIEKDIAAAEEEMDDDAESIITNDRYDYISAVVAKCLQRKRKPGLTVSDKIDMVVTNRFLALPVFALVMFLIYYISVTTVGTWVTDWANEGLFGEGWYLFNQDIWVPGVPVMVEKGLDAINCAGWLKGLILDGIVGGVGSVLGFVPQMMVLFTFLSFLEACGYMSRIAFIMDRIFRKFGLSGKSFIPMLVGTGCGVPGIMASRTIENERDRRMTIITTTFIPCGAKLPVIALIAGALFDNAGWVSVSAYFIGILAIVISGFMLKKTSMFTGDPSPFVMELPPYHMPAFSNIMRAMWDRSWSFIKKAGTVILISAVLLWFLMNFGFESGFGMVENFDDSLLAKVGSLIAWIFIPLGWGNWESSVATLTGLIAKENIVGTFGVLFGQADSASGGLQVWENMKNIFTPVAGYSFLAFNLLCAPCVAAMGAIRREMNSAKWTAFAIGYQCVFAYAVSLVIYQVGSALSGNINPVGLVAALMICAFIVYMMVRPCKKSGK